MLINNKKIAFISLMVALLATFIIPVAQAKGTATIAAEVDGGKITKAEVMNALKTLSVKEADREKVYPALVDQMINERLIDAEIAKSKIESDPEFKTRLEAMKSQLIKTLFIEKHLKKNVTEKAVKDEYKKLKKANKGKKEAHARHILVKTEEEAKQIIKDLDNGAQFQMLAIERSSDPSAKNGGDVGFFAEDEIVPEFSKAAFKLKPGTYTKEAVKSQFGWHVIYLEAKRDRVVPDLKAVEKTIRTKLGQESVESLIKGLRAKADIKRFDMDGNPIKETKKN